MIDIELVIDLANSQPRRMVLPFPFAPTVEQVLLASGHMIDDPDAVSVWGHRRPLGLVLRSGDRVEITRSLRIDPKAARAHKVSQKPRRGWIQRNNPPRPMSPVTNNSKSML